MARPTRRAILLGVAAMSATSTESSEAAEPRTLHRVYTPGEAMVQVLDAWRIDGSVAGNRDFIYAPSTTSSSSVTVGGEP